MSIEGNGICSRTYQDAIDDAVSRGITIVVAAGNYNADVSTTQPGNCGNVITVGGVSVKGDRHGVSNYGDLVDIAAPSQKVLSTWNKGTNLPAEEMYFEMDGTSMAAPYVAGVVALMQSVASTPLTPSDIRSILVRTARPFSLPPSQPIGSGVLDAKAAVDMAKSTNPAPVADFTAIATEESIHVTDQSTINAGKLVARTINWGDSAPTISWLPLAAKSDVRALGDSIGQTVHVTLAVTDSNGMSDSVTKPVLVPYPKFEELARGETISNIGRAFDSRTSTADTARYRLTVPPGATNLTFKIFGGTGDVNLYARKDLPTFVKAVCSSATSGSNKTCTVASPEPGDWYVILYARSTFNGVSLVGNYDSL